MEVLKRIRQQLLSTGKKVEYIKYAVGEIFLVVIGILIALSVNNWNENRKLQIKSTEYLGRLKEDLINDSLLIENRVKYWTTVSNYGKKALKVSNIIPDSSRTAWEVLCNYYHASQVNFLDVERATYDELKSTGNLGLIPNIELRNKLAEYYRRANGNSKANWGQIPEYRIRVRSIVPVEFQEYYFDNCYEIFDTQKDPFTKKCQPIYSESEAMAILSEIVNDAKTIKSLRYWIIDIGIAIELAEKQQKLTNQLIHTISTEIKE